MTAPPVIKFSSMAEIVIRNVDDAVLVALRKRAAEAGTSLEEQARQALARAVGLDREAAVHRHDDSYSDDYLRDILTAARTIAVVGASPRRERPSHRVMAYLQRCGYRAIPVNPRAAGGSILGETCYAALGDVPKPVDMVDIFRRSEFAGAAVDAAIAKGAKFVWMQLGVRDDAAAARAEASGLKVVMNRCPAIEIPRLALPPR